MKRIVLTLSLLAATSLPAFAGEQESGYNCVQHRSGYQDLVVAHYSDRSTCDEYARGHQDQECKPCGQDGNNGYGHGHDGWNNGHDRDRDRDNNGYGHGHDGWNNGHDRDGNGHDRDNSGYGHGHDGWNSGHDRDDNGQGHNGYGQGARW